MAPIVSIPKVGLGRNTLIQHSHLSSTPYKEVLDTLHLWMITPSSRAHSYVHKHFEVAQWVHHLISNSHIKHRMCCHHSTTWTTITIHHSCWCGSIVCYLQPNTLTKKKLKRKQTHVQYSVLFSSANSVYSSCSFLTPKNPLLPPVQESGATGSAFANRICEIATAETQHKMAVNEYNIPKLQIFKTPANQVPTTCRAR
jgi:hypothetical protein